MVAIDIDLFIHEKASCMRISYRILKHKGMGRRDPEPSEEFNFYYLDRVPLEKLLAFREKFNNYCELELKKRKV